MESAPMLEGQGIGIRWSPNLRSQLGQVDGPPGQVDGSLRRNGTQRGAVAALYDLRQPVSLNGFSRGDVIVAWQVCQEMGPLLSSQGTEVQPLPRRASP